MASNIQGLVILFSYKIKHPDRKVLQGRWRLVQLILNHSIVDHDCIISQFHIAPHELKKIAQAKKSIPFYVIKRAKFFFSEFFTFWGACGPPKIYTPQKNLNFWGGPPEPPPVKKNVYSKQKCHFLCHKIVPLLLIPFFLTTGGLGYLWKIYIFWIFYRGVEKIWMAQKHP